MSTKNPSKPDLGIQMSRKQGSNLPTLIDVAKLAQVSTATTSRVLGQYGSVSEKTRVRVQDAAEQLGYKPNTLARSLITGQTNTLGVIFPDIENSFFAHAFMGIQNVAHSSGFEVLLINTDEDAHTEHKALDTFAAKRVDGIIFVPAEQSIAAPLLNELVSAIPLVLLDRKIENLELDSVVIDNFEAAKDATARLIDLGHRRIALLTGTSPAEVNLSTSEVTNATPLNSYTTQLRTLGYQSALKVRGIALDPELIGAEGFHPSDAANATRKLMELADRPTAILALDSLLTLGVLKSLSEHGLKCPKDVSLISFDDAEWSAFVLPPISVVAQPDFDLGAQACALLISRIQGDSKPPVSITLPTQFINRKSIAAVSI